MVRTAFRRFGSLDSALDNGRRLLPGDASAAEEQALEILRREPANGDALRLLGASLRRLGRDSEAEQAEARAIEASAHNPVLVESARAIKDGRWSDAEQRLRPYLDDKPDDAAALNMMARIAMHAGAFETAEALLGEALRLAPAFTAARLGLGDALTALSRPREAASAYGAVLEAKPDHARAKAALAAALTKTGDYDRAVALYGELIDQGPATPALWMSHGHLMKTTGRPAEAVDSYRKALAIDPGFGEAWWSLANLKTFRLSEEDIARLEAALADPDLHDKARLHLHFALGKALEDAGRAEAAFGHYAQGNRLRAAMLDYSADEVTREVEESTALFTAAFYAQRSGWGAEAADPLFILGMPRAGSTLIEQILASHSMVEGTSELPYIPTLAREMVAQHPKYDGLAYPALLARLDARETRWLGEEYLRRASAHRTTDKPFFIDKLPNNWRDIGFIRLILPRARIVDARRHPLACGFSNFKQHFAEGQGFSYSLEDFGRYYRDYLRLMAHFEAVFPGEIVRMLNETLIEHSEPEIRRLLDRLGLPFDPACLRFWENDRAVRTPSAEQVRQPINREGMEQWKKFEPWLGPLKQALGPALEGWDSGV